MRLPKLRLGLRKVSEMVEVIVRERFKEVVNEKGEVEEEAWNVKKVFSEFFGFCDNIQVSYNNHGHLVLRMWNSVLPKGEKRREILIVFSVAETKRIVDFVQNALKGGEER